VYTHSVTTLQGTYTYTNTIMPA